MNEQERKKKKKTKTKSTYLLGEVVDQLPVDEDVDTMLHNLLALLQHALLLSLLDFHNLIHARGLHLAAKDLDLVGVHGRVGNKDLGVLKALGLANADLLLQNEALVEERVLHGAAGLLDNVNRLEIATALQAQDGVDCDARKVLLVLRQNLGAQGGPCNVEEILLELLCLQEKKGGESLW